MSKCNAKLLIGLVVVSAVECKLSQKDEAQKIIDAQVNIAFVDCQDVAKFDNFLLDYITDNNCPLRYTNEKDLCGECVFYKVKRDARKEYFQAMNKTEPTQDDGKAFERAIEQSVRLALNENQIEQDRLVAFGSAKNSVANEFDRGRENYNNGFSGLQALIVFFKKYGKGKTVGLSAYDLGKTKAYDEYHAKK